MAPFSRHVVALEADTHWRLTCSPKRVEGTKTTVDLDEDGAQRLRQSFFAQAQYSVYIVIGLEMTSRQTASVETAAAPSRLLDCSTCRWPRFGTSTALE